MTRGAKVNPASSNHELAIEPITTNAAAVAQVRLIPACLPPAKSSWIKTLSFVELLGPEEEGGTVLSAEGFIAPAFAPQGATA